jgi:mRNA-degrading endonuclease RelE of RelBE toxin-antitoxin system
LKANRDIVRQRIGDHRLLFRVHSQTIELRALIPRRDLERRIKSLISG